MKETSFSTSSNSLVGLINLNGGDRAEYFEVLWKDKLCAVVSVNFSRQRVEVEQFTDDFMERPFFKKDEDVTLEDVLDFLEDRCFPKRRENCNQLLKDLGLYAYVPLDIVKKTHGVLADDYMWVRFKGEKVNYDDVKVRDN